MNPPTQDNNPQAPEDNPPWPQRRCESCQAVTKTLLPHCQVCRGKAAARLRVKEKKNEAKEQGKCIHCYREDAVEGVQSCAECLAKRSAYTKNRRESAKEKGKCTKCINNDALEGRVWCQKCLDKEAEHRKSKSRKTEDAA